MLLKLGAQGILGIAFSAIGLASLAVAAWLMVDLQADRATREHVTATVVGNERSCHDGCTYRPVVEYEFAGRRHAITGVVGNSSPVFAVGESVTVLVPPADPRNGRIDHWTESGFGILFGLGFFAIFGGIGLPSLVLWLRRRAGARWAKRAGLLVLTRFVEVASDTRIRVNGRSPYRIVSQWHNPRDRKLYRFESEPVWFDPRPFLEGREQIGVKLDPEKPRRYWMDTGFLPEAG
jgi:hypothetical protein